MSTHRHPLTAAGALAVLALAVPSAAAARPALDPLVQSTTHVQAVPAAAAVAAPRDRGLEWGSTALGAGGASIVFVLASAGALTGSRRRHAKVPAG